MSATPMGPEGPIPGQGGSGSGAGSSSTAPPPKPRRRARRPWPGSGSDGAGIEMGASEDEGYEEEDDEGEEGEEEEDGEEGGFADDDDDDMDVDGWAADKRKRKRTTASKSTGKYSPPEVCYQALSHSPPPSTLTLGATASTLPVHTPPIAMSPGTAPAHHVVPPVFADDKVAARTLGVCHPGGLHWLQVESLHERAHRDVHLHQRHEGVRRLPCVLVLRARLN